MRVRIARDELRRIRELSQSIEAREAEIADLVAQIATHLLCEPGFGPLTAPKLVGASELGVGREPLAAGDLAAPASRRSRSARAKPTATGSTAAATARSTRPSTASPSRACAAMPRRRTTSRASGPKAGAPKKRSGVSTATSPAASDTCFKTPRRAQGIPTHQLLDTGTGLAAITLVAAAVGALLTDGGLRMARTAGQRTLPNGAAL